mgnify:CR=1 FL=1
MSQAKMTLIGLYNYDNDLFDNLTLPDGIDKSTLVDNILLRGSEFEVMYPDIDFLKYSIGAWSRKWSPTITRWVTALAIEYNPLENYDRYEHWTDYRDIAGSSSGSDSGSSSGSTEGTTESTTTNKVSAYDSGNALTTNDQSETNGSDSTSNSGEYSSEHSDEHSTDDDLEHDGRIHGNIGVTTSQQMLKSELDLGYWNIYEKITDLFLTEFVIPIY